MSAPNWIEIMPHGLCYFFMRDVICLSLWVVRLLTFVLDIRMLNTANGLSCVEKLFRMPSQFPSPVTNLTSNKLGPLEPSCPSNPVNFPYKIVILPPYKSYYLYIL